MEKSRKRALIGYIFTLVILLSAVSYYENRFDSRAYKNVAAFKESAQSTGMPPAQIEAVSQLMLQNKQDIVYFVEHLITLLTITISLLFYVADLRYYQSKDRK